MAGWGLAVCVAALLLFSGECMTAAREAAAVFAAGVMPALFPMMVLAGLPWGRGRKGGGWRAFGGAVFFAFAAGSPAGARRVAALEGQGNLGPWFVAAGVMSPLFFLGTLSSWTGRGQAMGILLGIHWAGALLTGALAWGMQRLSSPLACPFSVTPMQPSIHPGNGSAEEGDRVPGVRFQAPGSQLPSLAGALPQAIASAARALLAVCGAMMLFGVAAAVLRGLLLLLWPGAAEAGALPLAAVHALLEIGGGAYALLQAAAKSNLREGVLYPLLCAACSFGGLSIWLQNLAYTGQSIRPGTLLLYRAVHGALGFGISWAIFQLWPQALAAVAWEVRWESVPMAEAGPGGWLPVGLLLALAFFPRKSKTC